MTRKINFLQLRHLQQLLNLMCTSVFLLRKFSWQLLDSGDFQEHQYNESQGLIIRLLKNQPQVIWPIVDSVNFCVLQRLIANTTHPRNTQLTMIPIHHP